MSEVTITDADREAAANNFLEGQGYPLSPHDLRLAEDYRRGECDAWHDVQAFARHREEAAKEARIAALREAAEVAKSHLGLISGWCAEAQSDDLVAQGYGNAAWNILQAILALSGEKQ